MPPVSGAYTFTAETDGLVSIYLNGIDVPVTETGPAMTVGNTCSHDICRPGGAISRTCAQGSFCAGQICLKNDVLLRDHLGLGLRPEGRRRLPPALRQHHAPGRVPAGRREDADQGRLPARGRRRADRPRRPPPARLVGRRYRARSHPGQPVDRRGFLVPPGRRPQRRLLHRRSTSSPSSASTTRRRSCRRPTRSRAPSSARASSARRRLRRTGAECARARGGDVPAVTSSGATVAVSGTGALDDAEVEISGGQRLADRGRHAGGPERLLPRSRSRDDRIDVALLGRPVLENDHAQEGDALARGPADAGPDLGALAGPVDRRAAPQRPRSADDRDAARRVRLRQREITVGGRGTPGTTVAVKLGNGIIATRTSARTGRGARTWTSAGGGNFALSVVSLITVNGVTVESVTSASAVAKVALPQLVFDTPAEGDPSPKTLSITGRGATFSLVDNKVYVGDGDGRYFAQRGSLGVAPDGTFSGVPQTPEGDPVVLDYGRHKVKVFQKNGGLDGRRRPHDPRAAARRDRHVAREQRRRQSGRRDLRDGPQARLAARHRRRLPGGQ